ncbi:hypothetical protein ABZ722_03535 [Streptomyces longwoodensis]|uniref:Uncharacterized protein n=1 Tax=Streptomyces lasalocidi TaxID=324833 RepID=A0A4U5WFY0_STRLS|nr:hypothetical protein [Streptomyces lasalocidi]TKT00799.1 hypothetical protein E4U91_12155 [Streptomyces lasalocidi]
MSRERNVQPRLTEPLQFEEVAGPARYSRTTDKPVQYVTVANGQGTVLGYVWANDEDDAAGWKVRKAGGDEAFNRGALYVSRLRDAKARGISPSAALAELLRDSDPANPSHVVPGSLTQAPSLQAVKELAEES